MTPDAQQIDLLMASAWPPGTREQTGDWLLRATSGVTRRANSALVIGGPAERSALSESIEVVEAFYAAVGQPTIFMLSDASAGAGVAPALIERGYTDDAATWMLTAEADIVTQRLAESADGWTVEATTEPTDAWFDTYWSVESGRRASSEDAAVLRHTLLSPVAPARYVTVSRDGRVAAAGQVVLAQGWGCAQCLVTAEWARRQGAARAVLHRLATEAIAHDVPRLFAAVMADNAASLALVTQASFARSHQYRYYSR